MQTTPSNVIGGYEDREYQRLGTQFLRTIRRGFLTDDPGLGKTPQAIRAAELPAMVVAPRYLCGQWEDAIRREHEDAVIAHADGTRTQRDIVLSKQADWYIVNYEMVKSYDMPTGIRTFINDESHHLRNRKADKTKAVKLLENDNPSARIYNLTATPFWKNIDDIWMQAHILYPDIFRSYHAFVKMYCISLHGPYGTKIFGVKKAMRQGLKDLLKPIMLGRTYAEVGRYLPEVVESVVKLPMPPAMRVIYEKLVNDYSLKWKDEEEQKRLIFQPTGVLHTLRQVTVNSGKFDAVKGIIEDNNDKPAVIGFWYKDHAEEMAKILGKSAVLITGDLPGTERQKLAMWAQQHNKHIVASQYSLMEGVNLYEYRLFIFAEEHYVYGSNHQFLSRVVRDRNDNGLDREPVRVFYVQVRGSIDETIHRIAKGRKTSIQATRELLELVLNKGK